MKCTGFVAVMALLFGVTSLFAQRPDWVDNPGDFKDSYFVVVGIAKNKKEGKAREKAENEGRKDLASQLKKHYNKDEVKKAKAHMFAEAFWYDQDARTAYALILLPKEKIDKSFMSKKSFKSAKESALEAMDNLGEETEKLNDDTEEEEEE